jgi:GH15 family glucan-1,4-alpha-glucosidase
MAKAAAKKQAVTDGNKQAKPNTTPIEDYALIGDCETAALVSRSGSIDWLCWPTFSSSAVFSALLGTEDHGFWKIAPADEPVQCKRQYRKSTMVLETQFSNTDGEVCVVDFMPPRGKHSRIVRIVRGMRGSVNMRMDLAIRFDYGRTIPWVTSNSELRAVAGSDMVVLHTRIPVRGEGMKSVADFTIHEGETATFILAYGSSLEKVPPAGDPEEQLTETVQFWTKWIGKSSYKGDYQEMVERSLMVLKAMAYRPTGGIVAAATTSLPESIGGERNWDYRYCWLRDTAFTLLVLMRAGFREEAVAWRRWLLRAVAGAPEQVQTIYGIFGQREMPEWEADWLPGYCNSRPVRIGNAASRQFQLDVFGEVSSALAKMPEAEQDIRVSTRDLQVALVNHLCDVWRKPDQGIWEVRGGPQNFTHSKVMTWVAFDRAIPAVQNSIAEEKDADRRKHLTESVERWKKECAAVRKEVCEKGFNNKLNSFVQAYGSETLDASCLRIPLVGFLPARDPRVVGTVDAIQTHLMKDGFVQRYDTGQTDDGLRSGEGQFLACSFWLVGCLRLMGRDADAKKLFKRLIGLANDVGLLSEEYDSSSKRQVGNFPQALSHIALLHAAFAISGDWEPQARHDQQDTSKP